MTPRPPCAVGASSLVQLVNSSCRCSTRRKITATSVALASEGPSSNYASRSTNRRPCWALEELAGAVEAAVEVAEGVGVAVGVVAGLGASVAAVEAEAAAAVAVGAEVAEVAAVQVAAVEEAAVEEVELVGVVLRRGPDPV
ncbi:unnamed protein product [Closterium sp. NIES-64]|nr:unnamed protein product [Closterium sp. NIES-64]